MVSIRLFLIIVWECLFLTTGQLKIGVYLLNDGKGNLSRKKRLVTSGCQKFVSHEKRIPVIPTLLYAHIFMLTIVLHEHHTKIGCTVNDDTSHIIEQHCTHHQTTLHTPSDNTPHLTMSRMQMQMYRAMLCLSISHQVRLQVLFVMLTMKKHGEDTRKWRKVSTISHHRGNQCVNDDYLGIQYLGSMINHLFILFVLVQLL